MAYLIEYEGLNLICFECGRYGHRKEHCQWTYVQKSKESTVQEQGMQSLRDQILHTQLPAKGPHQPSPSTDEKFGPWMLAGRGNRIRAWRKPSSTTGGVDRSAGQKNGRKSEQMPTASRFTVLAQMEEEETMGTLERRRRVWIPVKSNSEYGLSKATVQGIGASVEEGVGTETKREGGLPKTQGETDLRCSEIVKMNDGNGVIRVGPGNGDVESKGGGNGEVVKGKEVYKARNPRINNGPTEGVNNNQMGLTKIAPNGQGRQGKSQEKIGVVGRRMHTVVGGNINQVGSNIILNNKEDEGPKINGMLLLEGPERGDGIKSDDFLKEKFEQSTGHKIESFTDLEEDVGDDFNFMDIQDQGPYGLGEQGAPGQNYPMIG